MATATARKPPSALGGVDLGALRRRDAEEAEVPATRDPDFADIVLGGYSYDDEVPAEEPTRRPFLDLALAGITTVKDPEADPDAVPEIFADKLVGVEDTRAKRLQLVAEIGAVGLGVVSAGAMASGLWIWLVM